MGQGPPTGSTRSGPLITKSWQHLRRTSDVVEGINKILLECYRQAQPCKTMVWPGQGKGKAYSLQPAPCPQWSPPRACRSFSLCLTLSNFDSQCYLLCGRTQYIVRVAKLILFSIEQIAFIHCSIAAVFRVQSICLQVLRWAIYFIATYNLLTWCCTDL